MTVQIAPFVVLSALVASVALQAQPQRDYTKSCSSSGCHAGYARRAVVHGPVTAETCDACHEPVAGTKHRFKLVEEDGASLCFSCHDEFSGDVEHKPAADGECLSCHDPHASDAPKLLIGDTVGNVCAECHDELTTDLTFLHGPVAAGTCTACHNPHATDHDTLLTAEVPDLCTRCHTAIRARVSEKSYKHAPAKEECTACHNPHGADNRMMLNAMPPDLCVECHDAIEETMEDSAVQHDALTTGKSCTGCHQPHASDIEHILLNDPMDLCLSCHDRRLKSGDTELVNMARLLRENPNHHGPIMQKDCSACHLVHGGDNFRMLVEEFPPTFYAPFDEDSYALCFSCHEPDLVLDAQTDTLTDFRNGNDNLHYRHVNRPVKGRTCRACHNVHASRRAKQITETVPFGEWQLPLNYRQTPTGGSCQPGCHVPYRYDREKPVQNVPSP
ncbi:MAG: cytochrome c3 family protein [Phycisphaerae bacterium]